MRLRTDSVALVVSRSKRFVKALTRRDPTESFYLLKRFGRWLVPEYRFKGPHLAWWRDGDFTRYLARFDLLDGLDSDRRWMARQLIRLIADVPGDTAECGAYKGATSYLIALMNAAGSIRRTHYVFDSFEGLSQPVAADGEYWTRGALASSEAELRENLRDFANDIVVCKGWIPDRFEVVKGLPFAFVHVDVDLFEPTLASLEYFYPLVSRGGVIVVDDYGSLRCPGATRAVDEFLADKPEKMIVLSDGGGFLIKGTKTQPDLHALPH